MSSRWLRYKTLIIVFGCVCLAGLVILGITARRARELAIADIRLQSAHTLSLVVENLRGELAKYAFQPHLLSNSAILIDALAPGASIAARQRANDELVRTNTVTGASDTYLMDRDGLTIAASNWAFEKTFVGRNFDFRPYFQEAIQGRLGRFSALGTTSGERGYYFSYPIHADGEIAGVVVVKMDVASLESGWRSQGAEILVVDDEGIIFLSSRPEWRLRAIEPLNPAERDRLRTSRRYADAPLDTLDIRRFQGSDIVDIATNATPSGPHAGSYLWQSSEMPDVKWRVVILADASSVAGDVRVALLVAGFMLVSLFLASLNFYQRRRRLNDRLLMQEAAKAELETKVIERTKDLSRAVAKLRSEVSERQRAEAHLRRTQEELIQSSKLSALGRLSAGLSHELSQPLTAIRSYAENGRAFLQRNETQRTLVNLGSIVEMCERMARIIRNLRSYARDEIPESRPVSLMGPIRNALSLLDTELRRYHVAVELDAAGDGPIVMGGDVRLQQVFVNLVSNAIDAMRDRPVRRLRIGVRPEHDDIIIMVSDSGRGIAAEDLNRLFDPFFTTKEIGQGTGLGLSITYGIVKQFGGDIAAANNPEGGAIFTVKLRRADPRREAAE
jgi:two-component system C4-dicarboxylate transport sensor histidine kinase DctB